VPKRVFTRRVDNGQYHRTARSEHNVRQMACSLRQPAADCFSDRHTRYFSFKTLLAYAEDLHDSDVFLLVRLFVCLSPAKFSYA